VDAGACLRLQASPSRPPAEALSAGVPYHRVGASQVTGGSKVHEVARLVR